MKLGLFGGSFDPVHLGHLLVAQAAREELELSKLFFIPAAQSPFKPEHKPTPSESVQAAERAEAVRAAVGELPEDLRTPLILSEYEELSHAEIGEILKCSAKAVETRIYRARKQLRVVLSDLVKLG